MTFTHKPFQFACEIIRQFESEAHQHGERAPNEVAPFRIVRPDQLQQPKKSKTAEPDSWPLAAD